MRPSALHRLQRLPRAGHRLAAPAAVLLSAALLAAVLAGRGAAQGQQAIVHSWQRLYYAPLDGTESLLFSETLRRLKPALGDLDGDGDLDLLIGREDGRIAYFENQGDAMAPRWRLVNPAIAAQRGAAPDAPALYVDVGDNAAPTLVDLDGDGDLDLLVGSASGRVHFYRNDGNRYLPNFRLVTENFLEASLGLNVVVKFPDLDGDGLPDLTLGNEAGEVFISLNRGQRLTPRYCLRMETSADCLSPLRKLLQLEPEDNAVPEWTDWDRDGDLDLLVGKSDGTVALHLNVGTPQDGAWELTESRFNLMDIGSFAAPAFADVTGDGVPDLLLAGEAETVALYSRRLTERPFSLWLEQRNVLQVRRLGGQATQVRVATGDVTGDGLPELVVGTRAGELLLYTNVGTAQAPAFRSPEGPLLPTPQRAFAAPALVDVDGDGDLDLIVGGREGRLEWIENVGTARAPRWQARSLFYAQVDVGGLSVPVFADVDGDGDLDLLVGNQAGQVVYYENVGEAKRPDFTLRSPRLGGLQMAGSASPALFRWNPQGAPDLVVGNQAGTLVPAVRDPAVPVADRRGYLRERAWSGGLQVDSYSAPHFADLSGDGRPDLLLGSGSGALLYWRYEGSGAPQQIAASERERHSNVLARSPLSLQPSSGSGLPVAAAPSAGAGLNVAPSQAPEALPLDPIFVYEPSALERLNAGRATQPVLFDANGDGRLDLLVGTAEGKLLLFESGGDRRNPTWRRVTERFADYSGERYAAPALADLDGDGDLDLAVGNELGRVLYWENVGTAARPRFLPRPEVFAQVRAGRNAQPAFADVDGDGRPDLLVGNLRGEVAYFANRPGPRFTLEIRRFLALNVGVNASPTVGDLTARGLPYLLVGSDQGRVRVFEPTGTSRLRSSGWREQPAFLVGLNMPAGSHPTLGDVDGDGDLDLVVGSEDGTIRLYRNQARQPELAQAPSR